MKLTKKDIDAMVYNQENKSKDIRWDDDLPGFGIRIYPTGTKTFVMFYRAQGRQHMMKIGRYGVLTLAQARKQARTKMLEVSHGGDPLATRQAARYAMRSVTRYILTGAPGSGKSSVLRALEERGFEVVHEAATDLVALEQARGVREPWKDPHFVDHVLHWQRMRFDNACRMGGHVQFFDRSPLCTYALAIFLDQTPSELLNIEIQKMIEEQTYDKHVFLFDLPSTIQNTDIRQITRQEALCFERIHKEVYRKFGFDCVRIVQKTVNARTENILRHIEAWGDNKTLEPRTGVEPAAC